MSVTTTKITYYTYFSNEQGYYADYQPNWEWSFTKDIDKAKEYKTLNGAIDRLFYMQSSIHPEYSSNERCLVEKHSTIIKNGNDVSISSKYITRTFEESIEFFKERQNIQTQKRVAQQEKQFAIHEKYLEREIEKNLKEKEKNKKIIKSQDDFYSPKCVELQTILNTSEYLEKRKNLIVNYEDSIKTVMFYEMSKSQYYSNYFALMRFFTVLKVLFDNDQEFSMENYQIKIKEDVMENVRQLFIDNGIFESDFCKFSEVTYLY